MKDSHDRNDKQTAGQAKLKASPTPRKSKGKEDERSTQSAASAAPIGRAVTEEQYRARVSQKAYELYEKRQAVTPVEDWLEAERLVKTELLAEGQWAGSV